MPSFKDADCPVEYVADVCIQVTFPNKKTDFLILQKISMASSTYDGFLKGDEDVGVVLIDVPMRKKQLVSRLYLELKWSVIAMDYHFETSMTN